MSAALTACGSPSSPVSPRKSEPASTAQNQASYCERLQPLLDHAVSAARIGTALTCLDMPNLTGLGWYGPPSAGEEAKLSDCFDQEPEYHLLVQQGEPSFELNIDQSFAEQVDASGGASLSRLIPWLPSVTVRAKDSTRVSARVSIKDARFVTLVGLATKLQGQRAETRCLSALCKPDYTYVNKALVGTPSVTLVSEDQHEAAFDLRAAIAGIGFEDHSVGSGGHELTSKQPVTLAIARSAFRTAQTERLCEFCGKQGQACCSSDSPCDGGLGCVAARCQEVGGPGQPCDGLNCAGGATCVSGTCQLSCGGRGQPCCDGSDCSGRLKCTLDPENGIESKVSGEDVEVTGGWLGTDEDRQFGSSSCGSLKTRARFSLTKLLPGRGNCDNAWWFEPNNEKDCRLSVHFSVSPFGSVRCRVETFGLPLRKPDVCL